MHITNSLIKLLIVVCLITFTTVIGRTNPSANNLSENQKPTTTVTTPSSIIIDANQIAVCKKIESKLKAIRKQYEKKRTGDPTKVLQLSSRYGMDIYQKYPVDASAYYLPRNYCSNGEKFAKGWSIAVDMYKPMFKAGTLIRIHAKNPKRLGYVNGWGEITDCGDFAWMGRELDLGMTEQSLADNWGVDEVVITCVIPPGIVSREQKNWLRANHPFQKISK